MNNTILQKRNKYQTLNHKLQTNIVTITYFSTLKKIMTLHDSIILVISSLSNHLKWSLPLILTMKFKRTANWIDLREYALKHWQELNHIGIIFISGRFVTG